MDVDVVHEVIVDTDDNGRKVVDILHNDEYLLKHNMVLSGKSLHRSVLDVPYLWDEMNSNLEELAFLNSHIPSSKVGLITSPT